MQESCSERMSFDRGSLSGKIVTLANSQTLPSDPNHQVPIAAQEEFLLLCRKIFKLFVELRTNTALDHMNMLSLHMENI